MNYKKGFTLIELLVVIAIISLLSSVVLASLKSARERGANASIKSSLNNMRSQSAVYYDNNNSYTGICSDTNFLQARAAVNAASGGTNTCTQSSTQWALSSPLKVAEGTYNYWCVDWSGNSKGHASALGAATTCP